MQKFQLGLIAMLICCVAFVSCERTQKMLAPAEPTADTMPADMTDMTDMMDMMADYMSWKSVTLLEPRGTGGAHGMGARTVYINEAGANAQAAAMETYPPGTMIVKEIMDDTNTFVHRVATMTKTADEMYAAHNGWMYTQSQRETADAELMLQAGDGTERGSMGCHGCHAEADTDSVFVKLPAEMMEAMTDGMDAGVADGDDMTDGVDAGDTGDMTDDMTGDANGATGDGDDSTEGGDGDTGAATNGGDTTENGGTTDNAGAAGN